MSINVVDSIKNIKVADNLFTVLSCATQPSTVIAYAVTKFLPITNKPPSIAYFAFDDGSTIAFDNGSSMIYMEI